MPLPNRWLTSLLVTYGGEALIVDCGDGAQIALKAHGSHPKDIGYILITHLHADHVAGLPGILLSISNAGRTEPVQLYGPSGLRALVRGLSILLPDLAFPLEITEWTDKEHRVQAMGLEITAFGVDHRVPCYGYSFHLPRRPAFDVEKALALGVDRTYWRILQRGECVCVDGRRILPEQVLGAPRKGLRWVYTTDTRPTTSILLNALGADLFVCEGMYGDEDKVDKAREHKHMTFGEAVALAKAAQVKALWLTHFSPSMPNPEEYEPALVEAFPAAKVGVDGMSCTLRYDS